MQYTNERTCTTEYNAKGLYIDNMPNTYKLTYFNLTARAETIRLIFAVGGIKFEDNRIEFSAWGAMKPSE